MAAAEEAFNTRLLEDVQWRTFALAWGALVAVRPVAVSYSFLSVILGHRHSRTLPC